MAGREASLWGELAAAPSRRRCFFPAAVHFPVRVSADYDETAQAFYFTRYGTFEQAYTFYLSEVGKAYSVDGTTVTGRIALGKPEGFVQIHVPGIQDAKNFTLSSFQIEPVTCSAVSLDGAIVEETLQAGACMRGFSDEDGQIFSGRLVSTGPADYTFSLANYETTYTLIREDKTLAAGKMYNFPALTSSDWTETAAEDLYVDLGLESGVKWAKCNLGAASETEYGDYYAWGELAPKDNYTWDTYLFNPSGDGKTFTRYYYTDFTYLQWEDDAAYAALGGKFRMPTDTEWEELLSDCIWDWKTTDDGYAHNGFLLTGPNKNTIFLPAAGSRGGTSVSDAGTYGNFWSSSLRVMTSPDSAWYLFIDVEYVNTTSWRRNAGFSIRPVYD